MLSPPKLQLQGAAAVAKQVLARKEDVRSLVQANWTNTDLISWPEHIKRTFWQNGKRSLLVGLSKTVTEAWESFLTEGLSVSLDGMGLTLTS